MTTASELIEKMGDKLQAFAERYGELEELMARPDVAVDYGKFQELAKERASLEDVVSLYQRYRRMLREEMETKMKRLSSIGKPLADVEVRIVDEEGNDVPSGDVGEIVARGDRLMKGYWGMKEATASTIRSGWLYTGDLGYIDVDGYIFLAGRAKDFIKRGGEMISPEEVEQVLLSHPQIEDAAIIGVPDDYWSERVRAIVVPKKGERPDDQEIMEYCRHRLASFKKPEAVVYVEELPRNPMGKVLKRVLREQFSQPIEI